MSSYVGADGLIVWGVSKVDPVSLDVVLSLTLSEYHDAERRRLVTFGHPYDGLANCVFLMDAGGNVQELSLVSAGSGISDINGDANPALMIYDLLTHPFYGLRKSAAVIDQSSFDYAARTLANGGLGMSEIIDTATDADSMIGDILATSTALSIAIPRRDSSRSSWHARTMIPRRFRSSRSTK